MTKNKSKSNAVLNELRKESAALDKLRRKRSAAIKAVAEANAALDAHFKYWAAPGFLQQFNAESAPGIVLAATAVEEELEYHLAIELNNVCYIDQEIADDYGSVQIIERTEAVWNARAKAAKGKAA